MILDNAIFNNCIISFLKKKTKHMKDTALEHEFLHVQYCAHILKCCNEFLQFHEGLKEYDDYIANVRNVVKYFKSFPQRWGAFKDCIYLEEIEYKSHILLGVPPTK